MTKWKKKMKKRRSRDDNDNNKMNLYYLKTEENSQIRVKTGPCSARGRLTMSNHRRK